MPTNNEATLAVVLGPDREITGLTADSRAVQPGFLFAALPGSRHDGRAFLAEAIARGASTVLVPADSALPAECQGVTVIEDPAPRRRFALLAAGFYRHHPRTIAAVTGTNGKTSTVQFARQLWTLLGRPAVSLGTLGAIAPDGQPYPGLKGLASMTTPDPVALHAGLAVLAEAGIDHVALEASSHGLDQSRLDGLPVSAAGFTNLSRDHLDYHGSMEVYLSAKAALFERVVSAEGTAVLNADTPEFAPLAAIAGCRGLRVIGYGEQGRDLRVLGLTPEAHGQRLDLSVFGQPHALVLPLVGRFQAWNALCALGLVLAGIDDPVEVEQAVRALEQLQGVAGRVERVGVHPSGAPIYVDYAHSPDALETVLTALRPHARGRLVVAFGCGGDRDRGKRPVMGAIAARLADRVIVTDDNPRSEDPAAIRREILTACPTAEEIGDRALAIRAALDGLAAGDLVVIAGKGHEQGQIIAGQVRPFDDAAEVRAALAEAASR